MSATTVVSVETTTVQVNQPQSGNAQATPVPQSEWDVIRAQLQETPQNPEGWNKLIDLAEESSEIEKIQASYEGLLQAYPNTVSHMTMTLDARRH
jgi:cleavage stimulation factor subunit 3